MGRVIIYTLWANRTRRIYLDTSGMLFIHDIVNNEQIDIRVT